MTRNFREYSLRLAVVLFGMYLMTVFLVLCLNGILYLFSL